MASAQHACCSRSAGAVVGPRDVKLIEAAAGASRLNRHKRRPAAARAQGSGPFGLLGPAELRRVWAELQAALAGSWPRLRELAARPGAAELRAGVLGALSRRALARTIKAVLGPQARPRPRSCAAAHRPLARCS